LKKMEVICLMCMSLLLASSIMSTVRAKDPVNMKTFLNSNLPGLNIQVNATAEALPTQNITVILKISQPSEVKAVHMHYFNLSVFGFLYGKERELIANITGSSLKIYNITQSLPENIWGTMYGEITLTCTVEYEQEFGEGVSSIVEIDYLNVTVGFTMTYVENIYLKAMEDQFQNLNTTFFESFNMTLSEENIESLNRTYWDYVKKYNSLQGSEVELTNLRSVSMLLGITTGIFLISTVYLLFRKPKEYW